MLFLCYIQRKINYKKQPLVNYKSEVLLKLPFLIGNDTIVFPQPKYIVISSFSSSKAIEKASSDFFELETFAFTLTTSSVSL